MAFSVLLGSGAQLFFMGSITCIAAALGFLSPANRGSLMTMIVVFYVLCAVFAGYASARFYKMFGGENWKRNVFLTATSVPGFVLFSQSRD
jgi:transmembrane 9 superfamily protein 2/4